MKNSLFQIILVIFDLLGFNFIFRLFNKRKIRVIMYHGITDRTLHPAYWLHLHKSQFIKQIEHLKNFFNVVPAEILTKTSKLLNSAAVITFDDGLANVFEIARPILLQDNLPAICFVVPGLSEQKSEIATGTIFHTFMTTKSESIDLEKFDLGKYDFGSSEVARESSGIELNSRLKKESVEKTFEVRDYLLENYQNKDDSSSPFKLMTVEQIIEFANSKNLSIGGHTFFHPALSSLTIEQQEEEIKLCLDKLNEWLNKVSSVFCYPSGKYTNETIELMKKYNIQAALSTNDNLHDIQDDRYRINRISIGSQTSIWEFKARMSGLFYSLFGKLGA